ncbi:MAG: pyruvate ferredoxin oxidoreductase [Planctomycetota bacterium]
MTRPRRAKHEDMRVITGNSAVAHAVRLARVQVVSAYPITPQTSIVEKLSEMCASGELAAEFIKVESEHSAMSCLVGSALAGARSFTATSSHGLAYMHEVLHWAAGMRLPIVLANVSRAMGPGWNIWTDHTDSLSQRDTGWAQFYCESNQEVLDTVLQAFRIAEEVLVPVMVVLDAFSLSHTSEGVAIPSSAAADGFLPPWRPKVKVDTRHPRFFAPLVMPDHYMEHRWLLEEASRKILNVAARVDRDFGRRFGRRYGIVDPYRAEDADVLLLAVGSAASTAREVIDDQRRRGRKAGLVRLRLFRPFPAEELRRVCAGARTIAVLDRDNSFGAGGILAAETRAALYDLPEKRRPRVAGYIAGLGGRDITPAVLAEILAAARAGRAAPRGTWVGLKP